MVSNFGCFDGYCEKKSVCGKFIGIKLANVAFFLYLCMCVRKTIGKRRNRCHTGTLLLRQNANAIKH